MAWRGLMSSLIEASLDLLSECVGGDSGVCAERLLAAADAMYTPLKPIDSGLGEAKKIASSLAAIIANAFILMETGKLGEQEALEHLKSVLEQLEEKAKSAEPKAFLVIEKAGLEGFEPASSPEARESLVSDIREYVEPPQPAIPRRRRQPRRPDPRQRLRRLLRELGRRDPILAREVAQLLRGRGVSV